MHHAHITCIGIYFIFKIKIRRIFICTIVSLYAYMLLVHKIYLDNIMQSNDMCVSCAQSKKGCTAWSICFLNLYFSYFVIFIYDIYDLFICDKKSLHFFFRFSRFNNNKASCLATTVRKFKCQSGWLNVGIRRNTEQTSHKHIKIKCIYARPWFFCGKCSDSYKFDWISSVRIYHWWCSITMDEQNNIY